jgi:hypothetical protein
VNNRKKILLSFSAKNDERWIRSRAGAFQSWIARQDEPPLRKPSIFIGSGFHFTSDIDEFRRFNLAISLELRNGGSDLTADDRRVLAAFLDESGNGRDFCGSEPPRNARFLLRLLPKSFRVAMQGDLEEEYWEVLSEQGERRARFWYWEQIFLSLGPIVWRQIRRLNSIAGLLRSMGK